MSLAILLITVPGLPPTLLILVVFLVLLGGQKQSEFLKKLIFLVTSGTDNVPDRCGQQDPLDRRS